MINVLFLSAEPSDQQKLDLDSEFDRIETRLAQSTHGHKFQLYQKWKVRPDGLLDMLHKFKPHIVHFSGHGNDKGDLFLEGEDGASWRITAAALHNTFRVANSNTRLVVLNACYSRALATDLCDTVDCVVGMRSEVYDSTAAVFSEMFYGRLGDGMSIREAFDHARQQIENLGLPKEKFIPQLLPGPAKNPREIHPVSSWETEVAKPPAITEPKPPRPGGASAGDLELTTALSMLVADQVEYPGPEIRRSLDSALKTDEDFTGFLMSYFPDAYQRKPSGERVGRVNLLLTLHEPAKVAKALLAHLKYPK